MTSSTTRQAPVRSRLRIAGSFVCALILAAAGAVAGIGTTRADDANGSQPPASGSRSHVPAVWVTKKINFVFQGFTTHYSCDGLESAVKSVLLQLGARKSDLKVHQTGCTRGFGAPEPFPGVAGTFSVLEPASKAETSSSHEGNGAGASAGGGSASASAHPVQAEWQTVKVRVGESGLDQAGQCELIDQVKRQILPLFTTRDVKFESHCVPHQFSLAGSTLQAEVLKAPGRNGNELAKAPGSGTAE